MKVWCVPVIFTGTRDHSLLEVSVGKWKMYHKSVVLWTYVPQVPQIWYKCGTKHRSSLKHINISKNCENCVDIHQPPTERARFRVHTGTSTSLVRRWYRGECDVLILIVCMTHHEIQGGVGKDMKTTNPYFEIFCLKFAAYSSTLFDFTPF